MRAIRSGHPPSLLAALVHFETSFAVWMLLGALGPHIMDDFRLSPALAGLAVATPPLAGASARVLAGWLADSFGARRVGSATIILTVAPLAWGWLGGRNAPEIFGIGLLLGIAGASFAIALPLASSNYPPAHQGLALGIAGAGNSGTVLAALFAPRLAERLGWHATFGLAIVPVVIAAILFRALAREAGPAAGGRRPTEVLRLLLEGDCRSLCVLYMVSFGGFVGFASYLPILLVDRWGVSPVVAGTLAAAAAGLGSFLRPIGGIVADRIGGTRMAGFVFLVVGAAGALLAIAPAIAWDAVLFPVMLGALGVGNGAITQLVPVRFPRSVGLTIGAMGAAGGIGGFLLPAVFGLLRGAVGSHAIGLLFFAAMALFAFARCFALRLRWTRSREHAFEAAI